jgi:ribonuclease P protein component
VLKTGRKAGDRLLLMSATRSGGPSHRYGLAVSKRVGGAVVRNRLKRRLRELLRDIEGQEGSWDVVVTARHGAGEASFEELRRSVESLAGRLGIGRPAAAQAGRRDDGA